MPRTIVAAALLLAAGISTAQVREGTYKPSTGAPVPWSINEHQTLIWGGQPYLPFGTRIDGTAEAVAAAQAAGIMDVIVDLPASGVGWDPVLQALSLAKLRYLLRIDSLVPMARGFAVEPQSYRISGITESRQVTLDIPGATSAFVVLATKADGSVIATERVPVVNGRLSYFAKVGPNVDHVLLVYPEMTSIEQQDFWEDLDSERDALLGSLKKHSFGPGIRAIVNPMGRGMASPGKEVRFVPTSPYFRMEFSKYLEERYRSVDTVVKSWSVSASALSQIDDKTKKWLITFDGLSHLVPLWTSSRGISSLLDPDTNTVFQCDSKRSEIWNDISRVINAAQERRFSRLIPAIRSVVDVPVVQDWLGWAAPYETRNPMIDGVGMRVSGASPSAMAETGGRAVSSILRWATRGWLVATDVDMGSSAAPAQIAGVFDTLTAMGARGIFLRTDAEPLIKGVAAEARQRAADTSAMNSSPLPVFFPENAYNPAVAQQLPGDHWWLPSPSDGNRIDLGSSFFAYRSGLSGGTFALWARTPGRYRLDMQNPKSVHFETLDGSDPLPKYEKAGVTLSLTEFPLIISGTLEVPIPTAALVETVQRFEILVRVAQSGRRETGQEEMYFNDAVRGFERNPGGCFEQMRKQFWNLAAKVAPYCWIEAEHYRDSNFSEVTASPGCSAGFALSLRTPVPPGPEGYFADYDVPVKTKADQEVWIAAKIPPERRGEVSITVGGQEMRISGDPLSVYDGGFGWYKLGTTKVAGSLSRLRLHVDSGGSSEIAVDVILITPGTFTPNGVTPPDPVSFGGTQAKPQKKGKKRGSGGS